MSPITADPIKNRGLPPNDSIQREAMNIGTLLEIAVLIDPKQSRKRQIIKTRRRPSVIRIMEKQMLSIKRMLEHKLSVHDVEYATPHRLPRLPVDTDKPTARLYKKYGFELGME